MVPIPSYRLDSLPNNPGIFYERMKPLMMTANTWKLTVTLDIQGIIDSHQDGWRRVDQLVNFCWNVTGSWEECKRAIQYSSIRDLENEAWKLREHLKYLLEEHQQYLYRRRREAPVFGFVSRILGPILGFTNYTEHEYLSKQVKDLYADKNEIVRVLNDSTHILQSEIDSNRVLLNHTSQNIEILQQNTILLASRMQVSMDRVDRIEALLQFTQLGNLFERWMKRNTAK